MSDKVLFEMRVSHDAHVEIYTSPEWDAYHNPQRRSWGTRGAKPKRSSLRQTLDSLQKIYDDLYTAKET